MRAGQWLLFLSLQFPQWSQESARRGSPLPSSELQAEPACLQSPPGAAGFNYGSGFARNPALIPGLGRSPGGGHGNPLQCSCLENPVNWGAWQAAVHGVSVGHD